MISLQNRWASFDDPNRWIIRFKDNLYRTKPWELDPDLPYPNYWDDTGYMQHRIIGPVVLTVHGKGGKKSVLSPGNYSRVPSTAHWEAPGHILTDEQKRIFDVGKAFGQESKQMALEVWPNLSTPNARVPAAGACAHGTPAGTGDESVEEVRDGGLRLVGSTP